jgi:hypothetical protein
MSGFPDDLLRRTLGDLISSSPSSELRKSITITPELVSRCVGTRDHEALAPASAGMPVIDVANLAQAIQQVPRRRRICAID